MLLIILSKNVGKCNIMYYALCMSYVNGLTKFTFYENTTASVGMKV